MRVLILVLLLAGCSGCNDEKWEESNKFKRKHINNICVTGDYYGTICEISVDKDRSCYYSSHGQKAFQVDCKLYDNLKKKWGESNGQR